MGLATTDRSRDPNGSPDTRQTFLYFGWLTLLVYLASPIGYLSQVPIPLNESNSRFLEAARIMGCDQARRQVASRASVTTTSGQKTSGSSR
jgi:hypothetical protein